MESLVQERMAVPTGNLGRAVRTQISSRRPRSVHTSFSDLLRHCPIDKGQDVFLHRLTQEVHRDYEKMSSAPVLLGTMVLWTRNHAVVPRMNRSHVGPAA